MPANNRNPKLSRTYCDGVTASQAGALRTTNPWTELTDKEEFDAWDTGWADSDGAAVDLSCCGYPVAGAPPPETTEIRY